MTSTPFVPVTAALAADEHLAVREARLALFASAAPSRCALTAQHEAHRVVAQHKDDDMRVHQRGAMLVKDALGVGVGAKGHHHLQGRRIELHVLVVPRAKAVAKGAVRRDQRHARRERITRKAQRTRSVLFLETFGRCAEQSAREAAEASAK